MDERPIGVFDSGLGGFSVLQELVRILPQEQFMYFADSGHNPYGQKSREEIRTFCLAIAAFLVEKDVKAIVVACNTATAAALPLLKKEFSVPVVGVIDAGVKLAVSSSRNKKIGVVATCFTAKSHAFKNRIAKIDPAALVQEEGSATLAHIIECGFEDTLENEMLIQELVARFPEGTDTLILGCTHFPLIKPVFRKYFSRTLIDPAQQTAREVKSLLTKRELLAPSEANGIDGEDSDAEGAGFSENRGKRNGEIVPSDKKKMPQVRFFVTADPQQFVRAASRVSRLEVVDITRVSL